MPDSSRIAFVRTDTGSEGTLGEIHVVAIDTVELIQLTDDRLSSHPALSPDRKKIMYAALRDPGALDRLAGQRESFDIWIMNADGKD